MLDKQIVVKIVFSEISFFLLLICGDPPQQHKILSQNARDSRLSYGVNMKFLYHLGSDW